MNPTKKIPSRHWRIPLLAIGGLVLLTSVYWVRQEINREDTPERFARLCERLLAPLPVENAPVIMATDAEQILAFQNLRDDLGTLARDCRQLAPIAKESGRQLDAALHLAQTSKGPGNLVMAGVETAVGLSLKAGNMVESGSKGLLQEIKGYIQLWEELKAIRLNLEVQRLKLVEAAPRFSGPATNSPVLAVQFTEEAPNLARRLLGEVRSMNETQTLLLTNASGQDFTRCVITVRLLKATGESYQHLYYVGSWAKSERRKATYSPNELFAETDTGVERVQVMLYAKELSSALSELTRKGETWPYTP